MFNPLIAKGIALMLLSTIFFSIMNAIVKYLNLMGYSSMENVFFRAFFMVLSVWSLLLGVALGDAFPNLMPSIGIVLILLSGALVAFGVYRRKARECGVRSFGAKDLR